MKSLSRVELKKCTTEELDTYLQYAVAQENYCAYEDMIKAILSILYEREKEQYNAEKTAREGQDPPLRYYCLKLLDKL